MLDYLLDPQFYWPCLALLFLAYLFAFVGARAVFHPDRSLGAKPSYVVQLIALVVDAGWVARRSH